MLQVYSRHLRFDSTLLNTILVAFLLVSTHGCSILTGAYPCEAHSDCSSEQYCDPEQDKCLTGPRTGDGDGDAGSPVADGGDNDAGTPVPDAGGPIIDAGTPMEDGGDNGDGGPPLIDCIGVFEIDDEDTASDIEAVSRCRSISGDFIIADTPNIITLEGMENLVSVGGVLEIRSNVVLQSLVGLQNLRSVGRVNFLYNNSLNNLNGLEELQNVGSDLNISNHPLLSNIHGLVGIQSIAGDLQISANISLPHCEATWLVSNVGTAQIVGTILISDTLDDECTTVDAGSNIDAGQVCAAGCASGECNNGVCTPVQFASQEFTAPSYIALTNNDLYFTSSKSIYKTALANFDASIVGTGIQEGTFVSPISALDNRVAGLWDHTQLTATVVAASTGPSASHKEYSLISNPFRGPVYNATNLYFTAGNQIYASPTNTSATLTGATSEITVENALQLSSLAANSTYVYVSHFDGSDLVISKFDNSLQPVMPAKQISSTSRTIFQSVATETHLILIAYKSVSQYEQYTIEVLPDAQDEASWHVDLESNFTCPASAITPRMMAVTATENKVFVSINCTNSWHVVQHPLQEAESGAFLNIHSVEGSAREIHSLAANDTHLYFSQEQSGSQYVDIFKMELPGPGASD
jgi:hypothetical protein